MKHYYLIEIQFLGFRFYGWQTQKDRATVQETILKVLKKIFSEENPKIFGCSRTDSMVSAEHYVLKLKLDRGIEEIISLNQFEQLFNDFLPQDIKFLNIKKMDEHFDIVQSPKLKEYHYYFSFGEDRPHPFCAPILTYIKADLDLELMKKGAALFIGTHQFKSYCYRPHEGKNFEKNILECTLEENSNFTANFFPAKTYLIKVRGHSFVRHQIRLMAGTLFRLGMHEITLIDIQESLSGNNHNSIGFMAPASGLILYKVEFQ